MRVVKLGGSLLETGKLFDCLKHIISQNEKTVVVCGGGFFADTVRTAQKTWHFDDIAAHEMATLAMQQTAIMCQNLQREFMLFSKTAKLNTQKFLIWSPDIEELNADNIQPSWEITSDSLAAWLTTKLNADELIIVKSCEIDSKLKLTELAERLIVDDALTDFVKNSKFDLKIISVTEFLTT